MTDFPFPPAKSGEWRALSRAQREEWLVAARNRHFKWLKRRGGWKDAPAGTVFRIDGAAVSDFPALLCSLGEAINGPGGYFGLSLEALVDCLGRGFGVASSFVLQIESIDACANMLDGGALASWARARLAADDFFCDGGRQWLVNAELDGLEAENTLLNVVLESLLINGVVVEGSSAVASGVFTAQPRSDARGMRRGELGYPELSGVYQGVCSNVTAEEDAVMSLRLSVRRSGRISGSIEITGDLIGSGYLIGGVEGETLTMSSRSDSCVITWRGERFPDGFAGDYDVAAAPEKKLVAQRGTWRVTRQGD